jgi:phosphate transport system permease protein
VGTLVTAGMAMAMALPWRWALRCFWWNSPRRLANGLAVAVELLAGIPSIVYGMWGLFVLAPWFAEHVQVPLFYVLDPDSFWGHVFDGIPNGANIFTGDDPGDHGAALYRHRAARAVLSVPPHVREAAYGMGCTPMRWCAIMLPYIGAARWAR